MEAEGAQRLASIDGSRYNLGLIAAGLVIGICFAFYLPLLRQAQVREETVLWFFRKLLPVAVCHLAALIVLCLVFKLKARGVFLFWCFSTAALLAAGGATRAIGLLLLAVFALILIGVGGALARLLLPVDSRNWAVSLGFGIAAASFLGALLASIHLFEWWTVALVFPIFIAFAMRPWSIALLKIPGGGAFRASQWSLATALALEGIFLVAVFVFVAASRPEASSDAMRFYWPYVKLLKHFQGFFSLPFQWPYIIPQAGLTYAATLFVLFGEQTVRWAMVLVWIALIGIATRSRAETDRATTVAVVLVMASCPVLLGVTSSLMQDAFVCLVTVIVALVCLEGKASQPMIFWAGVGAAVGIAWTAKYSTLGYAAPLALCALVRSRKANGWKKSVAGVGVAAPACLVVAGPWLWHTYRQSGDPFFPFFLRIFPAPLWPHGVGKLNLDTFRLPPGPRGWFAWPLDLTYHTDRFVEGYAGSLGLILPVLLVLVVPLLWKGPAMSRALLFCGVVGTALLWMQTAYIRYWLPGLWLLTLAAAPAAARLAQSPRSRFWLCAAAVAISLFQLPFNMMTSWLDPKGWAWDYYTGKVADDAYVERGYPGFSKFQRLQAFNGKWPKVWVTAYEGAGHLQIQPMDALLWELELHGLLAPREKIQYLGSAGCDYWIVNRSSEDAKWLRLTGISSYYWDEKDLVAAEGTAAVYRMKPAREALEAFDTRARLGTDLILDGEFEGESAEFQYWSPSGGTKRLFPSSEAKQGKGCALVAPGQGLRQDVALPPGVHAVELRCWARSVKSGKSATAGFQVSFVDQADGFFPGQSRVAPTGGGWKEYRVVVPVPAKAVFAIVYLSSQGDAVYFDDVHLYSVAPGK